ncbi:MAG: nucleotide exchange factor GrpE [Bacteroidaceae bacterium]
MSNKEQKQTEEMLDAQNDTIQAEIDAENTKAVELDNIEEKTEAQMLAEANEKIAELQDKYLRQVAEFDNYRKRTIKEKTELILNGGEKVISSFLLVLDDMERALENFEKANDIEALKEGVELIFQKMTKVLAGHGLKKIEIVDQDFNTDYHEAIAMIPAPTEDLKGKIIDCVQSGYMLNDKVIRHAKVAVGQ